MEQAEEAAAEAEAQRGRALGGVGQRRIVDRELGERGLELLVVGRVERVDAAEHHRADFLEARDGFLGGVAGQGDRVADLHVRDFADVDDDISHGAGAEFVLRLHLGREHADFLDDGADAVEHQLDRLAGLEGAREDADVTDDALVGVEEGIEDQRAVLRVIGPAGRRDALDDRGEDLVDADAGLARGEDGVLRGDGEDVLDLAAGFFRPGAREVDLIDDRDDLEALVHREGGVGDGLGFHALGGVDQEHRAFAGGEGARDFVGEVDVSRGVDEVEDILLTVRRGEVHRHRVALDRDALLALEVHRVEELLLHLALLDRLRVLEQAVGKGRLAVVDVRDDAEVADVV